MSRYVFLLTLLSIFLLTCAKTFNDRQGTKLVVVTGTNFFHQSGQDFPESEVIDLESDIDGDCNGWTEFPVTGAKLCTGALLNIDSNKGTEGAF